jgi:hypothetical protein
MAHKRNDEFYLYTGLTANGNECYDALMELNQSGISYRHLHYGDPTQLSSVIQSVTTWFPKDSVNIQFPFITYMEIYDNTDDVPKVPKVVVGLEAIKNTNWSALVDFQG